MKTLATLLVTAGLGSLSHSQQLLNQAALDHGFGDAGQREPAMLLERVASALSVDPSTLGPLHELDYDGDGDLDVVVTTSGRRVLCQKVGTAYHEVDLGLSASFLAPAGAGSPTQLKIAGGACATRIENQSGAPLTASSVAVENRLYPISELWFLDATTGFMGIGNSAPVAAVDVSGPVRARAGFEFPDGTLQTTATLAGAVGFIGDQGPTGPAGPQGLTGGTGAQGPPGPDGPRGPTGPTGPTGTMGLSGSPGSGAPDGLDAPGVGTSQVYVIGRGDWVPGRSRYRVISANNIANGASHVAETSANEWLMGRLILPEGAVITGIEFYAYDSSSSTDIKIRLVRALVGSTITVPVHAMSTEDSAGAWYSSATLSRTATESTQDYYVIATAEGGSWSVGGTIGVKSVLIAYDVP